MSMFFDGDSVQVVTRRKMQNKIHPETIENGFVIEDISLFVPFWCMGLKGNVIRKDMIQGTDVVYVEFPDVHRVFNTLILPEYIMEEYNHVGNASVTCCVCGAKIPKRQGVKTITKKYVCRSCMEVQSYSTRNNNNKNKDTKSGLTFGFELECIPKNKEGHATMQDPKFGFIPTSDASLPTGGVEFKSPIFHSLRGVSKMFNTFEDCADFSNDRCGQHIHVGHKRYNRDVAEDVRDYAVEIFEPLNDYMINHEDETTKLCGRYFGNYRHSMNPDCTYPLCGHDYFINLENNNTIEFRISKFVNHRQYIVLANMWGEVMLKVMEWYDSGECNSDTARKLGKDIKDVFVKYVDGKAWCQVNPKVNHETKEAV